MSYVHFKEFVKAQEYSVTVEDLRIGHNYWALPNGEIFEVSGHQEALDELSIDIEGFIKAGAIRIASDSRAMEIYVSTEHPSKLLDTILLYLGERFKDRFGRFPMLSVEWGVYMAGGQNWAQYSWAEFAENNFKLKIKKEKVNPKQMTLLQAARKWKRSQNPRSTGAAGALHFLMESAREGNPPGRFSTKEWLKVLDEFGVEDDSQRIAFLENVAAYL